MIAVRNLGPTLSKKEQDGLFKPFYKNADPEKEGVESNGMGLSVSQQIAKRMGGQINFIQAENGC